ncbi:hypothetical protein [Clostridium botulinum]|uniref:hypothetical protein n=1 Tax=Clostridium botulinum TaxID=1491 RepID=UPI0004D020F4|nr:hypothetical protein [Clostridium botulinum]
MNNIVELKNLGIQIDLKSFSEDYKKKNIAFFALLDNAVKDKNIKVYRAIEEENDYYNLIVIEHNNIYNAFPEPLLIEYIPIEDLENKISIEKIEKEEMDNIMRSQREASYMYLKTQEDKAKLVLKLIKLTNGQLTKEEIEKIVNNIEIKSNFNINIIRNAEEFAKELTLRDYEDDWRYEDERWCNVFLVNKKEIHKETIIDDGNFQFGLDGMEKYERPNFNINKKYGVLKVLYTGNTYTNINDEEEYTLIIYIPNNNPYKIDDSIQYVLKNFNI